MDRNATAARDETGDRLTRQWITTARKAHEHIAHARDDNRVANRAAMFFDRAFIAIAGCDTVPARAPFSPR